MAPSQALAVALLQSLWQVSVVALLAAAMLALLRGPALRHAAGMVSLLTILAIPMMTFAACLQGDGAHLGGVLVLVRLPAPLLHAWMPVVWLAGAGAMLLMHGAGLAWLWRLERRALPLPAALQARLHALRRAMGIGRAVAGRVADGLAGPCTARLLKPVIYLPATLAGLPPAQFEALLAHELAHIRRLDWLSNGLQCLAESLLFFHPAVWWLGRRIRAERELACDRLAVAAGADPLALAEALAGLARARTRPVARPLLAAGGGDLARRIADLLGQGGYRQGWRAPLLLVLLLLASIVIGEAAGVRPLERWLAPPPPLAPPAPPPPAPPLPPPAP